MVKIRHLMRETCTSSLIGSLRLCLSRLGAGELVSSLMCGSAAGSAACSAAGSAAGSGMDSGAKGVGDALRDGLGDWLGSLLGDGLRGRCLDCVTSMGVEMGAASMWAHSAENAEDNSSSVQPAISLGRATVGAAGASGSGSSAAPRATVEGGGAAMLSCGGWEGCGRGVRVG